MRFYKILNKDETRYGLKYHYGWNEDPVPWNSTGTCSSGGIYFAGKDILAFLGIGPWIREVKEHDERIYKDPNKPEKFKSPRVFLGKKRKITLEVIKELVEEGADIHADDDYALRWAAENGHLEMVQYLVEKGADVHTNGDCALWWAAENGHFEIMKFLIEKDADIHAICDDALRGAARNGYFEIVKFLVEKGANVHADCDYALRSAAENGHFEIVKFLIEKGADVHANSDYALRWATINGHVEIAKYLERIAEGYRQMQAHRT